MLNIWNLKCRYTCGRWADQHPVPDSGLSNTWFDERQDRMAFKIRKLLRDNFTSHGMPYTVQQAKIFYESCLDLGKSYSVAFIHKRKNWFRRFSSESIYEAGLKPLQSLLTTLKLPQVPVALKKDNEESNHYLVQLARLKKHLGKDLFFGAEVYSDPRNNSRNIIILDIPDTESILPRWLFWLFIVFSKITIQCIFVNDQTLISATKTLTSA